MSSIAALKTQGGHFDAQPFSMNSSRSSQVFGLSSTEHESMQLPTFAMQSSLKALCKAEKQ